MRRYIIITASIGHMGGAEMYTNNKCNYLEKNGWVVDVYYGFYHDILIPSLKKYEKGYKPELRNRLWKYSSKTINCIIEKICSNIKPDDKVIVESHLLGLAPWGELVAQRTGGKHILNCLEEKVVIINKREVKFLEYKLKRNEILNICSEKSIKRYFGRYYKTEFSEYIHNYTEIFCSNVVSDDEIDLQFVPHADYNILSVGRIDKPYISNMLEEILLYVSSHPQNIFNLLVIGGSDNGDVEKRIELMFCDVPNVNLIQFGYMYPIPQTLINMADVGIATANSTLVPAGQGIPTIAYDIEDLQPIGVYGYTTNNIFKRDNEPSNSLCYWLEQILIKKIYAKTSAFYEDEHRIDAAFKKDLDFINLSPDDHQTYSVMSLYPKWFCYYMRSRYFLGGIKRLIKKYI